MEDHVILIKKPTINFKLESEVTNKQTTIMEKQLAKGPIEAYAYVQYGL